ncbi:MAG: hypothetical protein AAGN35_17825 [Bacteroidota bacterium]
MFNTVKTLPFLALAALLVFGSCKDDPPTFPNEITSAYYFQIVIDGDTTTYQEGINDYGNIVGDFWGGPVPSGYQYAPFTCIASAEAIANTTPENLAQSGAVAILINTPDVRNTFAEYSVLPTTGDKGIGLLARTTVDSAVAGGFVSWFDANGTEFNTNNGTQSNASFVVTEVTDQEDQTRAVPTYKTVALTFSCTLYDENGNARQASGRARGRMVAWQ